MGIWLDMLNESKNPKEKMQDAVNTIIMFASKHYKDILTDSLDKNSPEDRKKVVVMFGQLHAAFGGWRSEGNVMRTIKDLTPIDDETKEFLQSTRGIKDEAINTMIKRGIKNANASAMKHWFNEFKIDKRSNW